HIGALDAALEQAPEVFEGVGMDLSVNIGNGMVDDLMGVFALQSLVRDPRIGEEIAADFDMLLNLGVHSYALGIGDDLCPHLAVPGDSAALQHTHDDSLARSARS